jgi:P4 family phage/plasmid primase-like protien
MVEGPERQPIVLLLCPICSSPVKPAHKDDIGTQFYECEKCHEKTAKPTKKTYKPMPYVQFDSWCENGVFNPVLLALDIIQNYMIRTNIETDELFLFNETSGIYDRNGDAILRSVIENCLGTKSRKVRANEVLYHIHVKTMEKLEESKKIAVLNGLLDVQTGELLAFNPNEFVTVQLPITYDKNAVCPEILKFFNEIAPADLEPMFEELFGYCLFRELSIHKATVLLGEGYNGKSTFLDLLTLFLGKDNVSHVTLQQICEGKFELAELHGKLANIVDDLPGIALKTVGAFKTVTGNAPILVQRKHKNPFNEWSTTKQLFGCNKLPRPSEDTIAYFRRFNIVPFNRFFTGKADDKQKLKKISTPGELSGMLNLALTGLKRLQENGDYSGAKSIEETRQLYIKSSDSCKAFVEEKLEESESPEDYITTENLYQIYVTYCQENRLPKIEKKPSLDQAVRQNFPNVDHEQVRYEGEKRVWAWRHLKKKSVLVVLPVLTLCLSEIIPQKNNYIEEPKTTKTAKTKPSVGEGPGQRLSIQEMLELLHNELPKGREFSEQQFLDCAVKHGWTRQDHDAFFRKLVDDGSLLRTPGGNYVWA